MEKIHLNVEPQLRDLVPAFLASRRRDLERMREALYAGDLAAIRDVGQTIRCFSRVYGFEMLTSLGEEIQTAADECSTLRIVHLQSQLADFLARVEVGD